MEIQFSSLKNETVIFIIPHTINTITIHVFKILSSIIPNYFQYSFDRDRVNLVVSKKLKPVPNPNSEIMNLSDFLKREARLFPLIKLC